MDQEQKKPANIYAAIAEAMKRVGIIEKNKNVGSGANSYKGVSDYDAMKKIQKAFADIGLVFFLSDSVETTELQEYEKTYWNNYEKKQVTEKKQRFFTRLECTFTLAYAETGETLQIKGHGHGADPLDKAVGKALTYAKKTSLIMLLLSPTGDDTDDHHSEEQSGSKKKEEPKKETAQQPKKKTQGPPKDKAVAPELTSNAPEKKKEVVPFDESHLDRLKNNIDAVGSEHNGKTVSLQSIRNWFYSSYTIADNFWPLIARVSGDALTLKDYTQWINQKAKQSQ